MPLRALARGAAEAWEVPRDLALRRYPAFVTGGPLRRGEIPVFVFHDAEPADFARKLAHLARNRYATLAVDEYVAILRNEQPAPERAVLLTFDDGRGSLWSVAQPLLRRHGMRAVVFLVPGRMRSRPGPPAPTLDDVDAGRVPRSALARRSSEQALLSWEEVAALAAAGVFEFESHTLRHARVHAAPVLAGFATPRSRQGYDAFDQPLVRQGEIDLLGEEVPLGTPLLRSLPRMSEALRFFEDEGIRRACVEAVAAGGGEGFFQQADWAERLRREFARTRISGRLETREERDGALLEELLGARRLIEERTNRRVRHLCYPWHAEGTTAQRLSVESGYETAFCGKVRGVPVTLPGGDLRAIARVSEDYVELLPGDGRTTLVEILRRKWSRRFGGALG
jgi:peptidoglycan/xylan/chitin deacetylase (PgdA/CDA1 family)